jgi:hypothetical protein
MLGRVLPKGRRMGWTPIVSAAAKMGIRPQILGHLLFLKDRRRAVFLLQVGRDRLPRLPELHIRHTTQRTAEPA